MNLKILKQLLSLLLIFKKMIFIFLLIVKNKILHLYNCILTKQRKDNFFILVESKKSYRIFFCILFISIMIAIPAIFFLGLIFLFIKLFC
jgi:hypothetical protein